MGSGDLARLRRLGAAGLGRLREGDEPTTFQDLQHTFGTLGAAVWPLDDLQGYMGHADIQTTMIYVHHAPKTTATDELSLAVEAATGLSRDDLVEVVAQTGAP